MREAEHGGVLTRALGDQHLPLHHQQVLRILRWRSPIRRDNSVDERRCRPATSVRASFGELSRCAARLDCRLNMGLQPVVEDDSPSFHRRFGTDDAESVVANLQQSALPLCRQSQPQRGYCGTSEWRQQMSRKGQLSPRIHSDDGVPHKTIAAAEILERATSELRLDHEAPGALRRHEVLRPPRRGLGGNRSPYTVGWRIDDDLKLEGRGRELGILHVRQADIDCTVNRTPSARATLTTVSKRGLAPGESAL